MSEAWYPYEDSCGFRRPRNAINVVTSLSCSLPSFEFSPPPPPLLGYAGYPHVPLTQPQDHNPGAYEAMSPPRSDERKSTKIPRASQACERCRLVKTKCDENQPCQACKEKGQDCKYREAPPQPTNMQNVAAQMKRIESLLTTMIETTESQFKNTNERLARLEDFLQQASPDIEKTESPEVNKDTMTSMSLADDQKHDLDEIPGQEARVTQIVERLEGVQPSLVVALDKSRDPPSHTVQTSLVLKWPRIQQMMADLRQKAAHPEPFFIELERARDLFREGSPDFSEAKVLECRRSFEVNFLNMHPIIPPQKLKDIFHDFLEKPQSWPKSTVHNLGAKRKRSHALDPDANEPYRSVNNSLVLLVLALGKIGLHEGKMSDLERRSHGSPMTSLPGSHLITRRGAKLKGDMEGPQSFLDYDVIPGLDYFAYAIDGLSHDHGGTLEYVWANILAALYYDQLLRPVESFFRIAEAGRALLTIFGPLLPRLTSAWIDNEQTNQLVIAYWTCLQLESELLAEMQFPPSEIFNYEKVMPYPNFEILSRSGVDPRVCESYGAQMFLCKHFHSIYNMFQPHRPVVDFRAACALGQAVGSMEWASEQFQFHESDAPASEILSARLRAKYWGAQVITYRPFVEESLQCHDGASNPELLRHARLGINALVESTRAYHKLHIEARPIITNIFGTMYFQWGNLLVLTACSKSLILQEYISKNILHTLYSSTIDFFEIISLRTSVFRAEIDVLRGLKERL